MEARDALNLGMVLKFLDAIFLKRLLGKIVAIKLAPYCPELVYLL
jgi:hypothetical protein